MLNVLGAVADLLDFAGEKIPAIPLGPYGRRDLYPVIIDGVDLPTDCLIQVRLGKNILMQDIPGGTVTLKTKVSNRNVDITITGRIITRNNSSMLDELKTLIAVFAKDDALVIQCPYLDLFGVKKVVLTDFEPLLREGWRSVMWFTYRGVSDEVSDRLLELKQSNLQKLKSKVRNATGLV